TLLDWDLARHHVQFSVSADLPGGGALPPVAGDGVMLQQVLVNLLRNAIDAMVETPVAERRLDVVCRVDAVDDRVEIAITDAGCGVGQDAAAQLFMPFFSTKPTGMGVGLNICRSLIELHQGRLWFTPNAVRGCTFYVALPLALMDEAEQLPEFLDSKDFVA
ncbi:MAG: ATP-binding protein, partial [Acidovorax sp.]|nr:ATP-binding protein [Acidovorax sp.]